jgi:hypothetical protein
MIRPKLTRTDLRKLWLSNPTPEVQTLLWEIKRLRAIVLRADQLVRTLGPLGGAQGMMRDGLRAELEGEPCVEEFPRLPGGG